MEIIYKYRNLNKKLKDDGIIFELLNSIGILENLDWKGCFQIYVDMLKTHANGPSEDNKNVKAILKESGYSYNYDMRQFKDSALLKRGNHFYALKKEGKEVIQYGFYNPIYLDEMDDYEMYLKDYNYIYKKQVHQLHDAILTKNYSYLNLNPNGKYVGDCSIRAIAQALHCDWVEALEILANQALKMNLIYLNSRDVVEKVLIQNGFNKCKHFPYKVTMSDFCLKMDKEYPKAEIVVYAGNNHITSLEKENDKYKIQDTWDCSQELSGDYFVKEIVSPELLKLTGRIIFHPVFKEGIVVEQNGNKCIVSFDDEDKILMVEWIQEHCKILKD